MKKSKEKNLEHKIEVKPNRFTYMNDQGLKVLTEQDILASIGKKDEKCEDKPIRKELPDRLTDYPKNRDR